MIFSALSALFVLPSLIAAGPLSRRDTPGAGACSGDCQGFVHDPSVVYNGNGTYYRFTTNNNITISTAPAISGPWTNQGPVLPTGSSIDLPGNGDLWAPDVFLYNGLYYMYYAVSASGSQNSGIGVATSPTMDVGSWTDHGSIGIPQNTEYNLIDPNLFQYDAGSPLYLSFGSYWTDIYQVTMADPPLTANSAPVHIEQNTTAPGYNEGSYQFRWKVDGTDYYYLFFSSGYCCNNADSLAAPGDEYKIMVCRGDSPTGPFVDQNGNDCLTQNGGTIVYASNDNDVYAPGGQGVFFDPQQNAPVVYYHYVKPSVGYDYDLFQFGWNRLDFSGGWPVVTA